MAELQQTPLENSVVTSKAEQPVVEQPVVVNQHSLIQALTFLRSELEKVQNEKSELVKERSTLLEQLEFERNKSTSSRTSVDTTIDIQEDSASLQGNNDHEKVVAELRSKIEQFEDEKKGVVVQEQEILNLKTKLEQVQDEKKQLEVQHQSLIAKLANFKTSIADKLKTDMEELNQKRQEIDKLNQNNQELLNTISQLQSELSMSRNEHDSMSQRLQTLETHLYEVQHQTSQELSEKDNIIRDLQINLDRSEREREDADVSAMELKSARDELLSRIKHLEREIEALKYEKEALRVEKNSESESLANLQSVLEEFEAAKQSEIREAIEGIQRRLSTTSKELAEFKERALLAENQLSQIKEGIGRTAQYEKEIKEKNLLIGKLRHEAVILNEHLTEALRRMREESSENNVDKRLITNLLIAFFNTPRGDSKRFEILQLMANMLQWSEEQKEQVGLIRKAASRTLDERSGSWGSGLWTPTIERPRNRLSEDIPRTIRINEEPPSKESFSDMWISFLLKEASKDSSDQNTSSSSVSTQSE
ncbi:28313_t:CDS:2 [Dentiscutata erythropus]|uniref:28313_t:CDS:1 n=1 Tax=Dentiscutata erythropus TaxID=1348616 RepID=A0A9N8YWP4_9GLOM|nr:28313_t:CDS:2 [Dentiscutata erythropus]